jgi:hypothetical protein
LIYGNLDNAVEMDNSLKMNKSKLFVNTDKEISFNEVGNTATTSAMELEFLKKTLLDKEREIEFLRKLLEKKI